LKAWTCSWTLEFDFLTWTGSWACSPGKTQAQENPRKVKKCLDLDSGYRKDPGLGPDPGRSLLHISKIKNKILKILFDIKSIIKNIQK